MEKTTFNLVEQLNNSDFQESLLANPRQALHKIGMEVPATTEVHVVRNSKNTINIVLPAGGVDISSITDNELEQISAGDWFAVGVIGVVSAIVGSAIVAGITYGVAQAFKD